MLSEKRKPQIGEIRKIHLSKIFGAPGFDESRMSNYRCRLYVRITHSIGPDRTASGPDRTPEARGDKRTQIEDSGNPPDACRTGSGTRGANGPGSRGDRAAEEDAPPLRHRRAVETASPGRHGGGRKKRHERQGHRRDNGARRGEDSQVHPGEPEIPEAARQRPGDEVLPALSSAHPGFAVQERSWYTRERVPTTRLYLA